MEEILLALAKDSPWIALTGFLLWRHFSQADLLLTTYKSGAEQSRHAADSQTSLAASIESLERSVGTMQNTINRCEQTVGSISTAITEMRAEQKARP